MSRLKSRRDGTPIAVTTSGPAERRPAEPTAEPPVFVLIPGLGEAIRSWGRLPALLARDHPVVAYDLRGHGESGPALSGDYELPAHAADLATVLAEALPADAPYILVGHSWGGAVILRHAAEAPRGGSGGRMVGAVFVGSSGSAGTLFGFPGGSLPGWIQAALRLAWLGMFRLGALLRTKRWARPLIDRATQRLFFGGRAPQDQVNDAAQAFLATDPQVLADTMFASVRQDYTTMGPSVTVPSLVIWGERDREDPRKKVQELVASLPRARTVTFADAGHMVPLTHPERVADEIARWLPTVTGSVQDEEESVQDEEEPERTLS